MLDGQTECSRMERTFLPIPHQDTLFSLGIIFMSLDFLAASVPIYGETMVSPFSPLKWSVMFAI